MRDFARFSLAVVVLVAVILLFVFWFYKPGARDDAPGNQTHRPLVSAAPCNPPGQTPAANQPPGNAPAGNFPPQPMEAQTMGEGRREPGEREWKPDVEAYESEQKRLEAAEAAKRERALVALQNMQGALGRVETLDEGADAAAALDARVVWSFPTEAARLSGFGGPLQWADYFTPEHVQQHHFGMLKYPTGDSDVAALGLWSAACHMKQLQLRDEPPGNPQLPYLLAGQVKLPQFTPEEAAHMKHAGARPVVQCDDVRAVCNSEGWFAFAFTPGYMAKREARKKHEPLLELKVWAPACVRASVPVADAGSAAGVTIQLERCQHLIVDVTIRPAHAPRSELVLWVENTTTRDSNNPSLFLSCRVPASGRVRFYLPDQDSWPEQPQYGVRMGCSGDGWTVDQVQRLSVPRDEPWEKRELPKPLHLTTELELERAAVERVNGRLLAATSEKVVRPARIESSHIGMVSYSRDDGTFEMWVPYARGNWKHHLTLDNHDLPPAQFALDHDEQRPKWVVLERGSRGPAGPWRIELPKPENSRISFWYPLDAGALHTLEWVSGNRSERMTLVAPGKRIEGDSRHVLVTASRIFNRESAQPEYMDLHRGKIVLNGQEYEIDREATRLDSNGSRAYKLRRVEK